MAFKKFLIIYLLAALISFAICTPDCYDFEKGVTKKWNKNEELLPPGLQNKSVDWLTIEPGKNCAFVTFSDVYFSSLSP